MKAAIIHLYRLLLSKLMVLLRWRDRTFLAKEETLTESKIISDEQACYGEFQDEDLRSSLNDACDEQPSLLKDNDLKIVMGNAITKIKSLVEDIDNKTDLLSFIDAKLTVLSMAESNRDLKSDRDRLMKESLMREKDHSRKAKKKTRRASKNTRSSSLMLEPPSSLEPMNN